MSAQVFIRSLLDVIWNQGHTPKIIVDTTHGDVVVPKHVAEQYGDRLPLDLDASYPMNIAFDDAGLHADLSFNHTVTRCTFPWRRIYLVVDRELGKGAIIEAHRPGKVPLVVDAAGEEVPKPMPGWSPKVIKGGKN